MDEYTEIVLPESKLTQMSEHTYYFKYEGDSMFPLIESGDSVFIDTEREQEEGDICLVAVDETKDLQIGKYWGDGEYYYVNPLYSYIFFSGTCLGVAVSLNRELVRW